MKNKIIDHKFINFGEKISEFKIRVLNEREARAGAGILFFFAMIAFMNAWLTGDFSVTEFFVVGFLIDFSIRVFINPRYSPSLIVGRFAVRNQKPEYVGAPQKRFAWGIGFVLSLIMFFLVVVFGVIGPINLLICLICLTLLFFESSFGICIGCMIYNMLHKEEAKLCPGGVCEIHEREEIQSISVLQAVIALLFITIIIATPVFGFVQGILQTRNEASENYEVKDQSSTEGDSEDCYVPDWAKDLGHKEQYVLHNGCN